MSIPEDNALNLVGLVYDAALDQRKWSSFLETFTHTSICALEIPTH